MKRPVLHPHYDCLEHWRKTPCVACFERRRAAPLRALFFRTFARFVYD